MPAGGACSATCGAGRSWPCRSSTSAGPSRRSPSSRCCCRSRCATGSASGSGPPSSPWCCWPSRRSSPTPTPASATCPPRRSRRPGAWACAAGELVRKVEVPVAVPLILTGLRVSAVQVVATATLGALVGYRNLGTPIVTGFTSPDKGPMLAGAIAVALLALLTDALFALAERRLVPWRRAAGRADDVTMAPDAARRRTRRRRSRGLTARAIPSNDSPRTPGKGRTHETTHQAARRRAGRSACCGRRPAATTTTTPATGDDSADAPTSPTARRSARRPGLRRVG